MPLERWELGTRRWKGVESRKSKVERSGRSKTAPAIARGRDFLARQAAAAFLTGVNASPPTPPPPPPPPRRQCCLCGVEGTAIWRPGLFEMSPFQTHPTCSTSSPKTHNAFITCRISQPRSLKTHHISLLPCLYGTTSCMQIQTPCLASLHAPPVALEPAATAPYRMKND